MNMVSGQSSQSTLERNVPLIRLKDDADLRKIYEFGRELGHGSYGVVYEATLIKTQTTWAVKKICKAQPGSLQCKMVWQEIDILKQLNHTHIIHLHEIYITAKKIYLVTELCVGGDLQKLMEKKKIFTEDETRDIIRSLTDAIVYLVKKGIIHRDLKPKNILIKNVINEENPKIHIKVADFGLSVQNQAVGIENRLTEVCGTFQYMAPEMMSHQSYNKSCDVWAIGVIMYILLCGEPPFVSQSESERLKEINKGVTFPQPIWTTVSDAAKTILTKLLKPDVAQRLTAKELLETPWIKGDISSPALQLNLQELMSKCCEEKQMLRNKEAEEGETQAKATCNDSEDTLDPTLKQ